MRLLTPVIGALILLTASAWGSAGAEDVPGVTDDEIRVGMITDLTGPLAFLGQESRAGLELYLRHINDQGGVHGRKLRLFAEDDGYRPPRSIAAFRKLVDRDHVFCFVLNLGSSCNLAVFPFIEREGIPLIGPNCFNTAMHTPPNHYVFALDPAYSIQAWIMVKHIVDIERAESPRLAVLYQDDDYGRDGLRGLWDAAAYYELPIVAETSYKPGAVDFRTQVLNLRQSRATHVILWTITRETAAVLREAHQLGWHPEFFGGLPTADDKVVELAGSASQGFKAIQIVDYWSDSEEVRLYHQLIEKYDPGHRPGLYHAGGVSVGQALVEALRRAGRGLTRENLVEALESFRGWDEWMGPPVTYGPNLRGGKYTAAFMVQADTTEMRFVRATDWIPFEMPDQRAQ